MIFNRKSGDVVRFLFVPFVLLPLIELFILIQVGSWIGAAPTIGLVLLTAAIGILLLRQQGYATLVRAREKVAQGQVPAEEMLGGVFVAVGGLLLLLPGFLTDLVGICCLVPPLRRIFLKRLLRPWLSSGLVVRRQSQRADYRR
ncbi:MAG: FxsA family protein [Cellvibrionaceae bacterium]|nr:FxsA family protein [Cellvibrionaceae bacterium]